MSTTITKPSIGGRITTHKGLPCYVGSKAAAERFAAQHPPAPGARGKLAKAPSRPRYPDTSDLARLVFGEDVTVGFPYSDGDPERLVGYVQAGESKPPCPVMRRG